MMQDDPSPVRKWMDKVVPEVKTLYERYVIGTWTYLTCLPQLIRIGRTALQVAADNESLREELLKAASPELYRPIKVGIASVQTPHSEVLNPWNPRKIDWSFTDEMIAMGHRRRSRKAVSDDPTPEVPSSKAPPISVGTPAEKAEVVKPLRERTSEELAATGDNEFAAFAREAGLENRTALKREAKRVYEELRSRSWDDQWTLLDILYPTAKIKAKTAEIRKTLVGL